MELLCRGVSRMDAARGIRGHGWPLYAGPRSNSGTREPCAAGPDVGCVFFCLLFFAQTKKSESPRKAKCKVWRCKVMGLNALAES